MKLILKHEVNSDFIYIGVVDGDDGKIKIFDQNGNIQEVRYSTEPVVPHQRYLYKDEKLIVRDENGEKIQNIELTERAHSFDYLEHGQNKPLKYCVSKNNVIFTNPKKSAELSTKGLDTTSADRKRYYSYINLKIVDVENYNYIFKRFYGDDQKETYRYIQDIDLFDVDGLGSAGFKDDLSLPLQTQSPFRIVIDDTIEGGVTEPAVLDIEFYGQIYQHQNNSGDYANKVEYTWDVKIISAGKGFNTGDKFRYNLKVPTDDGTETIVLLFKVTDTKRVRGTKFDTIIPKDLGNNNSAEEILLELASEFKKTGINQAVVVGNGLYLQENNPFSVSTDEIAVADVMNSQKMKNDEVPIVRVNTVSELPLECYPGFLVEVVNSFENKNNYYLEYESESNTDDTSITKADGYWQEVRKPYEPYKPLSSTMPHMISIANNNSSKDFVFIVSPIDWENRKAGTSSDNPSIFTDNTTITEVNYYKNRLLLMTGNGAVCSSQAGKINDLFIKTAISTSLTDPIDFIANSNQRVPIHGSTVVNDGMVLFGTSEQYRLSADRAAFTADTVNITKISNYTFDPRSKPIYLGTNVGFISEGLTRFYEMTNIYESGPVDINERSQQIQTQFGGGFNIPVSSREQSMALFYKRYTDDSKSEFLYVYRFRQENSQDSSQSSWVKWKVNGDVGYVTMPQDKILMVVRTDEGPLLYSMDSTSITGLPADGAAALDAVPHFTDGWYEKGKAVINGAPFTTTITFPTIYPRSKESL